MREDFDSEVCGCTAFGYWGIALLASLVIGLLAVLTGTEPLTDFLRHIREYDYRPLGGYAFMFPDSLFSDMNGYNPYYLFDTLVGWLASVVGLHRATAAIEALCFGLYSFAVFRNAKNEDSDTRYAVVVLGFAALFVCAMFFRAVQIRPVMFASLVLCLLLPSRSFLVGFVGGIMSAGLHWLYFLFTFPLAVGHWFSGSRRTSCGLLAGSAVSFLTLVVLSKGAYLVSVRKLFGVMGTHPLLVAPEMKSPIAMMLVPETAAIILAFLFTVYKRRQMNVYLATLIASTPLLIQERFAFDIGLPLMLFYVMYAWRNELFALSRKVTPRVAVACISAALMMVGLAFVDQMRIKAGQIKWTRHLALPEGTRVFSSPYNAYPIIYENKDPIQVFPPLETTLAKDKTSESVVVKIVQSGMVTNDECSYFERNRIDYVVVVAKVSAGCLVEVNKDETATSSLKMWRVKKGV